MKVTVEAEVDDDTTSLLVVDSDKSIVIWSWDDIPKQYRDGLTKPLGAEAYQIRAALVPAGYKHDIKIITQNPYFAERTLDKYLLSNGSTIWLGA